MTRETARGSVGPGPRRAAGSHWERSPRLRGVATIALTVTLAALIASLLLPYLAIGSFGSKAFDPLWWRFCLEVFAGPGVALACVVGVLVLVLLQRPASLALLVLAAIAVAVAWQFVNEWSHDLSHALFDDCRGYGRALNPLLLAAASGLIATLAVELKRRRSTP